ncbi:MAG: hypothetical protein NTW96_16565, partial [Planctomycetia bacterium]|nr:hypothetical protein [Planctomycetia bacterium]
MGTVSVAQTPSDTARTPSGDGAGSLLRTRYQPLIVVLAAASLGIVADRRLGLSVACWWTAAAVAWTTWFALWRASRAPRGGQSHFRGEIACRRRSVLRAAKIGTVSCEQVAPLVLLAAVAAVAGAWHHCRWSLFAEDDLGSYARQESQPACVEAIAV